MSIRMQEIYEGVLDLRLWEGKGGHRAGQREEVSCSVVSMEPSASPIGNSEAGMTL